VRVGIQRPLILTKEKEWMTVPQIPVEKVKSLVPRDNDIVEVIIWDAKSVLSRSTMVELGFTSMQSQSKLFLQQKKRLRSYLLHRS
jgi:hypothetical protein